MDRKIVPFVSACLVPAALGAAGCGRGGSTVVYTSVDPGYALPVLERFEERTGLHVSVVTDVEAQKTTGLFQRLLAERKRPRADLFWNSEVLRTIQLARSGVLEPFTPRAAADLPPYLRGRGGLWYGGPLRARVLIYNKERLGTRPRPRSLLDLAAPAFANDAAVARPLFGTTATHAGALCAVLGLEGMQRFFERLRANGVRFVEGNAVVRNLVASGELTLGLTDTDDAHEALLRGDPVAIVYPDQDVPWPGREEPLGTFVIPVTVALVRGGPNPEGAKRLAEFLLGREAEEMLVRSSGAFLPVRPGIEASPHLAVPEDLRRMEVSYEEAARGLDEATPWLQQAFLR